MLKIITDSSSNISQEEAAQLGVTVLPMTVIFGDEQFKDGVTLSTENFYDKLTKGGVFPHTSQLCEVDLIEAFKKECAGGDEVLVMLIASSLSGTYSLAEKLARESGLKNLRVYETGATTAILKILVLEALKHREKTAEEVVSILEDLRPKIKLYAALDTLEYLQKGGRLSSGTAFIGNLLKIKPVIILDEKSNVKLISKQFGFHLAIKYLSDKIDVKKIDTDYPVYLLYTMDDKNCNSLVSKLKLTHGEKVNICSVIGSHIGPRAAGIVYVEK